jgi:hypothetical protein
MTLQYNLGPIGPLPPLMVGGIQIGRDTTGNFALSPAGLAVRRTDGTYVTIDREHDALIDVSPVVFLGLDPWVLRIPVLPSAIRRGDVIMSSDEPFAPLFVLGREVSQILALDPVVGQLVTYVPPASLLCDVYVVAASLYDIVLSDSED